MRKVAFILAGALAVPFLLPRIALAGATSGEMLGATAAGASGYVGGSNPKVTAPLAPAGATSLPLGNSPAPAPQTSAPDAAAPPVAMPGPLPCSNKSPPCK